MYYYINKINKHIEQKDLDKILKSTKNPDNFQLFVLINSSNYDNSDVKKWAFEILQSRAYDGDTVSSSLLATYYDTGMGQDYDNAAKWYLLGGQIANVMCRERIMYLYHTNNKIPNQHTKKILARSLGHLARRCRDGINIQKNENYSINLYRNAIIYDPIWINELIDSLQARNDLGDLIDAFDYCSLYSKTNNPGALSRLSSFFAKGYFVHKNNKKAVEYAEKAYLYGGSWAFPPLFYALLENNTPSSYEKILNLTQNEINQGNIDAYRYLAHLYKYGLGVEVSPEMAEKCLQKCLNR